ncbi:uncharacterized protein MONBRDRAFT_5147 [Monosiga brevicollis MX1]|uniref:Rap-GAP domain-containing protein n=1 Tax=Monosiga brevicollis TaxID=81824 RepID=A9UQ22_MONBE|nr:uncharacterized protein MONBRDRAFT_5147 [Monosiga brevicollis MX1]EDQ92972.1 predicted protein [Monosiga brevicollis MX1]|eukprot:XP_001742734.1 hypothetical protein [Monosiga brevicollis MX1]
MLSTPPPSPQFPQSPEPTRPSLSTIEALIAVTLRLFSHFYSSGSDASLPPSPNVRRKMHAKFLEEDLTAFRCEDGSETDSSLSHDAIMTSVLLENPERETRWYFRYFLGKDHANLAATIVGPEGPEVVLLSVLQDIEDNHVKTILWRASGSEHMTFTIDKVVKSSRQFDFKTIFSGFDVALADRPIEELLDPNVQQRLLILEEQEGAVNFKIGILYALPGQETDDDMFSNEHGSPAFNEFCSLLGDKVELEGWANFRGGLDVKAGSTGTHSHHTTEFGKEIMFHVSTLLPYSSGNRQQLERKRHLGNDICNIVFVDGEFTGFDPTKIKSQFNHVFAVVSRNPKDETYTVRMYIKQSVAQFGPALPNPPSFKDPKQLRRFLLVKLLNGEKAALAAKQATFAKKRARTLQALIESIYADAKSAGLVANITSSRTGRSKRISKPVTDFRAKGQAIKVDKIRSGAAPTSTLSNSGEASALTEPWTPICITTEFPQQLFCGDQWDGDLLVATETGVYLVTIGLHRSGELNMACIIDNSLTVAQISVDERAGFAIFRTIKSSDLAASNGSGASTRKNAGRGSQLYIVPLDHLVQARRDQVPLSKKSLKSFVLPEARGCHLFAIKMGSSSTTASFLKQSCKLAVAVGKKEFTCSDVVMSLAVGRGQPGSSGQICVGLVSGDYQLLKLQEPFEVNVLINADDYAHHLESYSCQEIVEAEGDNTYEYMLGYNRATAFREHNGAETRDFEIQWRSQPQALVYVNPYILAFTRDAIHVATLINGNLVKGRAYVRKMSIDNFSDAVRSARESVAELYVNEPASTAPAFKTLVEED